MDPLFFNKVSGSVIAAILLVMIVNTVGETLFHVEGPEKVAFPVVVAVEASATEAVQEEGPSLAMLMASASADKGARQFAKCKSCHTVDKGGRNGTGPNLYGILGADIAAADGFGYSSALAEAEGNWTYEALDAWLANPKKAFPGNKMSFAGLRKPGQRADLIAYLRSFSDTPVALPEVLEAAAEATVEAAAEITE